MKNRHLIYAMLLFFCVTSLACAQNAPDQPMEIESQVPGEVQIVRWDMLLTQQGADAINKVAQPLNTDSKEYQAMTAIGYELRQAMADASTNHGVEAAGFQLAFAQMRDGTLDMPQMMTLGYFPPPPGVGFDTSLGGKSTFSRSADRMHVALNLFMQSTQFVERGRALPRQTGPLAEIHYDGDLDPGDAVAFLDQLKFPSGAVRYHLLVYEAFKAHDALAPWVFTSHSATWWCANGPSMARKWAGTAAVWESHADHGGKDVPADCIKKLSDGKELCLIGISHPSDAPFCWWDAHGKPIALKQNSGLNADALYQGMIAMVELRGSREDFHRDSPTTEPTIPNVPLTDKPYVWDGFDALDPGVTEVKAGAAVGPWDEVARLKANDRAEVDGVQFRIHTPLHANADTFSIAIEKTGDTDDVLVLTAVGTDGKEVPNQLTHLPLVDFPAERQRLLPPGVTVITTQSPGVFEGIAAEDFQYLRLCKRARKYITFQDFATQPQTPVKTDFTLQDLDAAVKVIQGRANASATSRP